MEQGILDFIKISSIVFLGTQLGGGVLMVDQEIQRRLESIRRMSHETQTISGRHRTVASLFESFLGAWDALIAARNTGDISHEEAEKIWSDYMESLRKEHGESVVDRLDEHLRARRAR
jgi:predicted ABC-type transport system involved in lysophospholipase L1 biosynthesis ATPase subunit